MDIVIIAEFCDDFSKLDNGRFLYLAKMLVETSSNNDIEIVTSSFQHTKKKHRYQPADHWPFRITFIEEPGYLKNVCLKRFKSHQVWGVNVERYLKSRKKPDVIYCAVPSLTGPNLVAKYCEKENVRFIIDVQDLWPEAFKMIFNIPVVSKICFEPFSLLANGIYKRADVICGVSETYVDRALKVNKKCNSGNTVFLGTNLAVFDKYSRNNTGYAQVKKEGDFWIAYCGTLGSSYDLTSVIEALALLNKRRLCFIVMGDGPKMKDFKEYTKRKGVRAKFMGRLPYDKMCGLLSLCDLTVNPIMHMAAQSIINKHADYCASGLPVISTQENEEYRKLVDGYRMGFNCNNNDPKDIADKIKKLIDDDQLRVTMGKNARRCGEERFDRRITYQTLQKLILNISEQ